MFSCKPLLWSLVPCGHTFCLSRVAASAPKQQEQDISHRLLNCSRQLLLAASMCAAATASSDAVLSSSDFVIPLRRRTSSRQQQQQGIRSSDRSAVSAAAASHLLAAHLTSTAATTSRLFQPHRTPPRLRHLRRRLSDHSLASASAEN
jgi:heme A synthase